MTVMTGVEVLRGYALRAAVRLVSKGLETVTPFLMSFTFHLQIATKREPTKGLEPLACSLRVIGQALQAFAEGCKYCISKPYSFLRLAVSCTVLRSRRYQSGIKRGA